MSKSRPNQDKRGEADEGSDSDADFDLFAGIDEPIVNKKPAAKKTAAEDKPAADAQLGVLENYLSKTPKPIKEVWCNEQDMRNALEGLMWDDSHQLGERGEKGLFVLKATPLNVAYGIDVLSGLIQGVAEAQNGKYEAVVRDPKTSRVHTETKYQDPPGGNVDLLIPLEGGQHWRLAIVNVKDGSVTSAILWDSMKINPGAVKRLQEVVDAVNKETGSKTEVEVIPVGMQLQKGTTEEKEGNNYSCGDFVIRETMCRKALAKPNNEIEREVLKRTQVQEIIAYKPDEPDVFRPEREIQERTRLRELISLRLLDTYVPEPPPKSRPVATGTSRSIFQAVDAKEDAIKDKEEVKNDTVKIHTGKLPDKR